MNASYLINSLKRLPSFSIRRGFSLHEHHKLWYQKTIRFKKQIRIQIYLVHTIIILFFLSAPLIVGRDLGDSPLIVLKRGFLGGYICLVYIINVSVLTPYFLKKKVIWIYFSLASIILVCSVVINHAFTRYLLATYSHLDYSPLPFPLSSDFAIIFPVLFVMASGTSLESFFYLHLKEQEKQIIEREKILAELSFLKSQVSPHFLFNTLTNIHALASDKSDDTEEAILQLSHILRYMLYESDVKRISLLKEIEYIKNYINLQMLRLSKRRNIKISLEVEGCTDQVFIEPMLFIPFVENAFKHGVSYREASLIQITLRVKEGFLHFKILNYKRNQVSKNGYDTPGIGLQNVKRRLNLLYPEQHDLSICEANDIFTVELTLHLK